MVTKKKRHEAIIEEALKRFERAEEAWRPIYEAAREDIRFVDDDDGMWDQATRDKRQNQPCLTSDKISGALDQVVGDHLQNRPGIKVVGAEDDDKDTAEVLEGLIRQIESRGTRAYKTAFKFSARGGFGAWAIDHDYLDSHSFDQDIILRELKNPFSVLLDPVIQTDDVWKGRFGFIFDDMSKDEFEDAYPKAVSEGSEAFDLPGSSNWMNKENVRVADYYRLVKETVTIGLTIDQKVLIVDEYPEMEFVQTRETEIDKLERYKITAAEVLEEIECVGRYIPIIPLFGKTSNVDGKMTSRGVVRKAKDPQKLHNYYVSSSAESIIVQPKAPFLYTPKMLKGHEDEWTSYATSNKPGLPYNPDPEAPGAMPTRQAPPQMASGIITGVQMSADDIKAATGIYDASLGARSNETSGKAIRARQAEGDTANFEFTDEFAESINYGGMVMVDLIPHIYDTPRQLRILGEDDKEKVQAVNQPIQEVDEAGNITWKPVNDFRRGKYDIRVRVGPSFATRRIETAEQLGQIIAQNPEMGMLISDLYYSSLDLVGADELVERMRKILIKKGVVEPTDEEKQELMEKAQNPQAQQAKQLKQANAKIEMANKQADTAQKNAKALESRANAQLKNVQALAEQMEIQAQQQDLQGLVNNIARLMQFANSPVVNPA